MAGKTTMTTEQYGAAPCPKVWYRAACVELVPGECPVPVLPGHKLYDREHYRWSARIGRASTMWIFSFR